MATTTYTTSITVDFTTADGAEGTTELLKAEVDSREDGLNGGDTTFISGVDSPAFLVFKSTPVSIDVMTPTYGNIQSLGSGTYLVEDIVTFSMENTKALNYPISGNFTYKWLGRSNGSVSHTENTLSLAEKSIGVLKISYEATYSAYRLNNIPAILDGETEFSVLIYIAGSA